VRRWTSSFRKCRSCASIAGVSIAHELSPDLSITLLEAEPALAYHTTGRSAATFLETYGAADIRALTTASRDFLTNPPDHFEGELMTPCPLVIFARSGNGAAVERHYKQAVQLVPDIELISPERVKELVPYVRDGQVENGFHEPGAMALDVHAIHPGFVRGLRKNGGQVARNARVTSIVRDGSTWRVTGPTVTPIEHRPW
jgi:D-arginine dehydrogenase